MEVTGQIEFQGSKGQVRDVKRRNLKKVLLGFESRY
jgi:hypothetical protein